MNEVCEADSNRESTRLGELRGVSLHGAARDRLRDISFVVRSGVTAIVGYSGAGKTSLLNLLAGFEAPDAGTVDLSVTCSRGSEVRLQLPLFWAPQGGGLWPHLTVDQHLTAVSANEFRPAQNANARSLKTGQSSISADELIDAMDLAHRRKAVPGELSQGERSRLTIARALASRAILLLLDEPLAHVDPARKPGYWQVIQAAVRAEGSSIVFASHEPDAVVRESANVICLRDGSVVYSGSTRGLYDHPPDRTTGEFLGRLNWFESGDASDWITAAGRDSSVATGGIRPERLTILPDVSSDIEVVSTIFSGGTSESVLRDTVHGRQRVVIHSSAGLPLSSGLRVRVSLS